MEDRDIVVYQFVDNTTGSLNYIVGAEPSGAHVESVVPLFAEGRYPEQPPIVWRHSVIERADVTKGIENDIEMTLYSGSQQNPWAGNGDCTSQPLYS